MKKTFLMLGLLSVLSLYSCDNKKATQEGTATETTEDNTTSTGSTGGTTDTTNMATSPVDTTSGHTGQ